MKTASLLLGIFILMATQAGAQSDNGRGRHKQIYAVPAPDKVVIDGKLDEWDLSGQIEMFVIEATRATQSAKFALMYDEEALYIGADVNDPTPMMNRHDPQVAPHKAWDADACQFRMTIDPEVGYPIKESTFMYKGPNAPTDTRTDIMHLLLWHFTDTEQANLQMHTGMTYRSPREAWEPHGLVPQEHFEGKYVKREDGTGYSFEYRIPWATMGAKRPLKGGDLVAGTVQFNWSRPDGLKTAGGSAWAYDVMGGPGFAFQSTECWGKIAFSETNNVPRELVTAGVPPELPLPLEFAYEVPQDSEVTVQLFNSENQVVRILVAQQQRMGGRNTERWDGLDMNGNLLPAGDYVWKGIYHEPISAKYRFSVHNSGQPPYPTDNNRGGWGGDHGNPTTVAALPDGMILAWSGCEYGWGIIRTDLNGKKLWGSKHDANHMATDGTRLYIAGGHGFNSSPDIQILAVADSRPSRFDNGIATLPAPAGEGASTVTGMAYHNGHLYVSYGARNLVAQFSTTTGELTNQYAVPAPGPLAVLADNSVAVISGAQVLKIVNGAASPWLTTHLDTPTGIAIGKDGAVYVANQGQLQNVSVFDASGAYVRSIGKAGGRPAIGQYDASGMYMAGGIDLDAQGRLWVAETTDGPKRISVWDVQNGANLMEFFGGSDYFAYGNIDPARPTEIYAHHVIWEIDWATYTTQPKSTAWRATDPAMMPPPNTPAYNAHARMMTASNGQQYMWGMANSTLSILLQREGDLFKPFAAVINVGDRAGRYYRATGIPAIDKDPETFPTGFYFWQDANGDQLVQLSECVRMGREMDRGYVMWLAKDLSVRLASGHVLKPISISDSGRPTYDLAAAAKDGIGTGQYLLEADSGEVYTYSGGRDPAMVAWAPDGTQLWSYGLIKRWHDALNLPVIKPGRLWGMTGSMGLGGDYFAHQTYFGVNHIFRTDGIYVAGVLEDGRIGGRGAYEGQPEGQNGSFVKLTLDGAERWFLIGGGQDARVWEVLGLESIQDLPGGTYQHTPELMAKAKDAQDAYAAALGAASKLTIARGRKALEVSDPVGKTLEDERGFAARAAYDAENLYVQFDVATPHHLLNAMSEPNVIFRGGNLIDIQLAANPQADADRKTPAPGDVRLLVTRQQNQPMAVLFQPKVKGFQGEPTVLTSPTGTESFDRIEVVSERIELTYRKTPTGFTAIVAIPQELLGLSLKPGETLRMDLGYIFGNKEGTRTAIRSYVNNNSFTANVVDDIPHESRLEPAEWGEATVE